MYKGFISFTFKFLGILKQTKGESMTKHLIKRKNVKNYQVKNGWYCETKIGNRPIGSIAKINDTIYIAETGYAIFAKGVIKQTNLFEFDNIEKFTQHVMNETNVKDVEYWFKKLKNYYNRDVMNNIFIFEYKITNTVLLDRTYPIDNYRGQNAWYYLPDNFDLSEVKHHNTFLTLHIPSRIRREVYNMYKLNSTAHLIDIDHFVPKSIGGPGNIIENLVPLGQSLNRAKSNEIPSRLFEYATDEEKRRINSLEMHPNKFYKGADYIRIGQNIVTRINQKPEEELKEIYKEIRNFHFPYLKEI